MTRPSVCDERPCRSDAARSLRSKPSVAIAVVTRSVVAGVTPASALITRETVFRLTPAISATSLIVGLMTTLSSGGATVMARGPRVKVGAGRSDPRNLVERWVGGGSNARGVKVAWLNPHTGLKSATLAAAAPQTQPYPAA